MAARMSERTDRREDDLSDEQGQRATSDADDKRADDARATVKGRHAGGQADEERQRHRR